MPATPDAHRVRGAVWGAALALLLVPLTGGAATAPRPAPPALPVRTDAKLIGYWHNWVGSATPYLPLREVPAAYTQVNIAFALPVPKGGGAMSFTPNKQSPEEFRGDVLRLQARGTRVLISVGGGRHPIVLNNRTEAQRFVQSLSTIIDRYGFDGLDINLEKESLLLAPGDVDFRRPTTPRVVWFIEAVRMLTRRYGARFVLSVSPETQFTVAGHKRYGGEFGGYLPVLHALRDQLSVISMQYYNSGTKLVYTARRNAPELIVKQGTPDFAVGLAEMLILGFPVAQDPRLYFPGFPAEKIVIGLPAKPGAAPSGGYLDPAELRAAWSYLATGRPAYPTAYRLRQTGGHPTLGGLMTWSINWDSTRDSGTRPYSFAATARGLWTAPAP